MILGTAHVVNDSFYGTVEYLSTLGWFPPSKLLKMSDPVLIPSLVYVFVFAIYRVYIFAFAFVVPLVIAP